MGIIAKYSNMFKNMNHKLSIMYELERKRQYQKVAEDFLKPILDNEREYVDTLKTLLQVKDVRGRDYIRVGSNGDGGYVMVDNFSNINHVYSIGIGAEVSFDKYFADRGADVYMYDHTIEAIPVSNNKMHWKKVGICGEGKSAYNLYTLPEMVEENGHTDNSDMILKMDVEGWEWDVFSTLNDEALKGFDQIVMELHGLLDLNYRDKILAGLNCLNATHQLVHVHANNAGQALDFGGWVLPDLLEVTYVNRANYDLISKHRYFPTNLDARNIEILPDIPLGYWD